MNKQVRVKNTVQILLATILMCVGFANAQTQGGDIIGIVSLKDGSAIPGVAVVVTGTNLIGKRTVVTVENGTYQMLGMPTGSYKVVFSLEGFQTITKTGINLDLGKTYKLDATMSQSN